MGINKVLCVIPEIAGKCKIWRNGKVVKKCLEAGSEFTRMAKENDGKLTIEELNKVYKKILPKGSKIEAVNDPQKMGAFLRNMKFNEDTISLYSNSAQALVIKNLKNETLFFVPIEKFSGDKAVNIATHEFEHVLSREMTIRSKLSALFIKILGQKRAEKLALKDAEALSTKLMNLQLDLIVNKLKILDPADGITPHLADQKGLLQYMGLPSKDSLIEQLRQSVRKILDPKSEKKNIKYLKALKQLISEESRAYRSGGQSAKNYLGLKEGSTMSEMTSQIYDETIGAIKKEIKVQKTNRLKSFLGIKPQKYEEQIANSGDLNDEMMVNLIKAMATKEDIKKINLDEIINE